MVSYLVVDSIIRMTVYVLEMNISSLHVWDGLAIPYLPTTINHSSLSNDVLAIISMGVTAVVLVFSASDQVVDDVPTASALSHAAFVRIPTIIEIIVKRIMVVGSNFRTVSYLYLSLDVDGSRMDGVRLVFANVSYLGSDATDGNQINRSTILDLD